VTSEALWLIGTITWMAFMGGYVIGRWVRS